MVRPCARIHGTFTFAHHPCPLVDRYSAGKEGVEIEQVATQMAKSVTQLYPTLTVSFSDIVEVSRQDEGGARTLSSYAV